MWVGSGDAAEGPEGDVGIRADIAKEGARGTVGAGQGLATAGDTDIGNVEEGARLQWPRSA